MTNTPELPGTVLHGKMRVMGKRIAVALLLAGPWFWASLALLCFPALPERVALVLGCAALAGFPAGAWFTRLSPACLAATGGFAGAVALAFLALTPQNDRDWRPEQERLARVEVADDGFIVVHFRNAAVGPGGVLEPAWEEARFSLGELERVDYVHALLTSGGAAAHGFLSFGFADGRHLAVSVEARRRRGRDYSPFRGLFRNYELIYVLGAEPDLIGSRAAGRLPVYLYPLRATPAQARDLFLSLADKTNQLAGEPEFYHTVTNNCVTTLRRHVGESIGLRIRPSWRILLSGYADELLLDRKWIDHEGSLASARERFQVNERAAAASLEGAEWSARIRAEPEGPGR